MALHIDRAAAMNTMLGRCARGVDRSLDMMHRVAVKEAPVRKDSARRPRAAEDPVKATRQDFRKDAPGGGKAVSIRRYRELLQANIGAIPPGQRNAFAIQTASRDASRAAEHRRGTGSFSIQFTNARTGETETNIGFNGKRLSAKAAVRGGNLRSKIHRSEVEIDGNTVRGNLRSEAPYSNLMEYGFIHVGGKKVTGKPFMRPAKAHLKANWRGAFKENGR